jgi:hypothetical protein
VQGGLDLGEPGRLVPVGSSIAAFLFPQANSMQRYCQLWKPLLCPR